MRKLGIPAPGVHRIDITKQIVPFVYMLSERIDGEAFSHARRSLGRGATCRIYRQLGDYLGRLHATAFDLFGDVREGMAGWWLALSTIWTGMLPAGRRDPSRHGASCTGRSWRPGWRGCGARRSRFSRQGPRAGSRNATTAFGPIVPRLLHMDLHPGNVLVRGGQVVGILDVEESIVGHNEYDLMRTELANFRGQDPMYARAFMDAYAGHVTLDDGYLRRKHLYDVSRTLAWIVSLILHADAYTRDEASRYRQAAREHLVRLTAG